MTRRALWSPHRRRIKLLGEFGCDVGGEALLVGREIGEEQVMADARGDRGQAALHARHVADRHPEADEAGRVLDVDVVQIGCGAGDFFEIFVGGAEIGVGAEILVLLAGGGV